MTDDSNIQRIARLTPLAEVLDSFALSVEPVAAVDMALADALGRTLAADVAVALPTPAAALALRDGYPVRADATVDASAYAPMPLIPVPSPIETGRPLPPDADAVAPLETVALRRGLAEISAVLAPGDGVLAPGGDAAPGVLRLAGARLRRIDVALMAALGIGRVAVRRPRVLVAALRTDAPVAAAAGLVAGAVNAEGGTANLTTTGLDAALESEAADAVIAIGGTGSGPGDDSVNTLARFGHVAFHGIAILPGETTAVGFVGRRPVLLLPGRLDSALAGWLTVGRRLLARLAFRLIEEQPFPLELARKVASPLGLAEVVPVRRRAGTVEPVAQGYLSPQALARSDGWLLVPADSEGFPAGSRVVIRPWP